MHGLAASSSIASDGGQGSPRGGSNAFGQATGIMRPKRLAMCYSLMPLEAAFLDATAPMRPMRLVVIAMTLLLALFHILTNVEVDGTVVPFGCVFVVVLLCGAIVSQRTPSELARQASADMTEVRESLAAAVSADSSRMARFVRSARAHSICTVTAVLLTAVVGWVFAAPVEECFKNRTVDDEETTCLTHRSLRLHLLPLPLLVAAHVRLIVYAPACAGLFFISLLVLSQETHEQAGGTGSVLSQGHAQEGFKWSLLANKVIAYMGSLLIFGGVAGLMEHLRRLQFERNLRAAVLETVFNKSSMATKRLKTLLVPAPVSGVAEQLTETQPTPRGVVGPLKRVTTVNSKNLAVVTVVVPDFFQPLQTKDLARIRAAMAFRKELLRRTAAVAAPENFYVLQAAGDSVVFVEDLVARNLHKHVQGSPADGDVGPAYAAQSAVRACRAATAMSKSMDSLVTDVGAMARIERRCSGSAMLAAKSKLAIAVHIGHGVVDVVVNAPSPALAPPTAMVSGDAFSRGLAAASLIISGGVVVTAEVAKHVSQYFHTLASSIRLPCGPNTRSSNPPLFFLGNIRAGTGAMTPSGTAGFSPAESLNASFRIATSGSSVAAMQRSPATQMSDNDDGSDDDARRDDLIPSSAASAAAAEATVSYTSPLNGAGDDHIDAMSFLDAARPSSADGGGDGAASIVEGRRDTPLQLLLQDGGVASLAAGVWHSIVNPVQAPDDEGDNGVAVQMQPRGGGHRDAPPSVTLESLAPYVPIGIFLPDDELEMREWYLGSGFIREASRTSAAAYLVRHRGRGAVACLGAIGLAVSLSVVVAGVLDRDTSLPRSVLVAVGLGVNAGTIVVPFLALRPRLIAGLCWLSVVVGIPCIFMALAAYSSTDSVIRSQADIIVMLLCVVAVPAMSLDTVIRGRVGHAVWLAVCAIGCVLPPFLLNAHPANGSVLSRLFLGIIAFPALHVTLRMLDTALCASTRTLRHVYDVASDGRRHAVKSLSANVPAVLAKPVVSALSNLRPGAPPMELIAAFDDLEASVLDLATLVFTPVVSPPLPAAAEVSLQRGLSSALARFAAAAEIPGSVQWFQLGSTWVVACNLTAARMPSDSSKRRLEAVCDDLLRVAKSIATPVSRNVIVGIKAGIATGPGVVSLVASSDWSWSVEVTGPPLIRALGLCREAALNTLLTAVTGLDASGRVQPPVCTRLPRSQETST